MRLLCAGVSAVGLILIAAGCSSAPAPPQPGTPAFYWGSARSTYGTGDFLKASDNLSQITKSSNDFTVRALPWQTVLSAGIAQGYMELASSFDEGARANRANPAPFRRQAQLFRGYASAASMETAESLRLYLASPEAKQESVPIAFAYPTGSLTEPVQLQRVEKGILFKDDEVESLQRAMVQRGVLSVVTRIAGSPGDTAKALALFQTGDVKIARPVFMLAMARVLHDQAALYGPKQLDQPNRVKLLCLQAEAALGVIPDSKDAKALREKIAKTRKASRIT